MAATISLANLLFQIILLRFFYFNQARVGSHPAGILGDEAVRSQQVNASTSIRRFPGLTNRLVDSTGLIGMGYPGWHAVCNLGGA